MGILETSLRLLRTVRHVPLRALFWRVRARAMRYYYSSIVYGAWGLADGLKVPGEIGWVGVELLHGDAGVGRSLAAGKYVFAGIEHELGTPPREWLPRQASALWAFNLHYHEWLADMRAADARKAAQALVGNWLMNFSSYHPVAWHPYPTSLRIVAWLTHGKWLLEGVDADFKEAFESALWRQLEYLKGNCEWDLGGNHLLKNLKAMIYGGLAFEGQREFFEKGMGEFLRQMKVQVLADGGHYERSPLYMAQVLRDVLEVRALLRKEGGSNKILDDVCARLGTALSTLTMSDGCLTLFNDSALMEREYVAKLLRLSGADEPLEILPQSGYARMERGASLLVMDAGKVGPDENPGHAHADCLSFELARGPERVFVNGGTYAYQDRMRNVLRGTPAHTTVAVDGMNSAEIWGGFRVGRRPVNVTLDVKGVEGGEVTAEGSHDGYAWLGLVHRRKIVMAGDGSRLRGEDVIEPRRKWWRRLVRRRVVAHFHVHPNVAVRMVNEREAELVLESGAKAKFLIESGRLDVRDSVYAPQFGQLKPTRQLVVMGSVERSSCSLSWQVIF